MADTIRVPLWHLAVVGVALWGAYYYGEYQGRTSKERLQKKVDKKNAELSTLLLPRKGGGYYHPRQKKRQ